MEIDEPRYMNSMTTCRLKSPIKMLGMLLMPCQSTLVEAGGEVKAFAGMHEAANKCLKTCL